MLTQTLDKIKRSTIMYGLVFMFFGFILLTVPEDYVSSISITAGYSLLVISLISLFDYIGSQKRLIDYIKFGFGLFLACLGFSLLVFETLFLSIMALIMVVLPILLGLFGIYNAWFFARNSGRKGWWILLLLSGVLVIFGLSFFIYPSTRTAYGMMQIVGGTLFASALISLMSVL